MQPLLRVRVVYQRRETAQRVSALAEPLGLQIESEVDLAAPHALHGLGAVQLVLLEQSESPETIAARLYSLVGANPELLIAVYRPAPRSVHDRLLLRAGAFDVLTHADLERDLEHTVTAARRVVALQEDRARLSAELAHRDKLSALGVLAAGVSHEINNPCGAILSNMHVVRDQLELLLSRPRFQRLDALDEAAGEWIEAVGDSISAANRIQEIVKTLNVFSRKSEAARPVQVDVNDEIRTVLRLIGKEVRFRAEFETDLHPELPRILAPPNCITQILTNLVVNALQALETSIVDAPRVSIRTDFDDGHVLLEVADNGPGIPPDVLSRVFDPFFTTKPIGKGTGLGLSIARQLVQNVGGEVFAEREPDGGARFTVVVERTPMALANPSAEQKMPPQSDRLRVLLLDDDELILRSMQRSLSPHFECQAVLEARVALQVLASDRDFDAVVCDVVMPEMNGVEFWSALGSAHPELARRTVFISGGITSEQLRLRVSDSGRPCLAKPVDRNELVRTIRRLGRPLDDVHR